MATYVWKAFGGVGLSQSIIPADRNFPWNPGLMSKGGPSGTGIPIRNTIFTTLTPSGGEDFTQITNAISNCPAGQVVKLNAGTFILSQDHTTLTPGPIVINKGITLRGSGAGVTILQPANGGTLPRTATLVSGTSIKTPDANADNTGSPTFVVNAWPMIMIGPGVFSGPDDNRSGSSYLTADGAQGAFSITVANGALFSAGQFVLLDELTGATFQPAPPGYTNSAPNQVWQSDRITFQRHNPSVAWDDDFPHVFSIFNRVDTNPFDAGTTDGYMQNEMKEIVSVVGNVVTFNSPLSISYRVSHGATLTRYTTSPSTGNSVHVQMAGVENLTCYLSGGGGIKFNCAAYCWAKNVEVDSCHSLGIAMANSFRCEVRDSYIHTSAWPVPSADSYAVTFQNGSSECLVENNIMKDYCKTFAARASGTGSVIAYNYMDDAWDYDTNNPSGFAAIVEVHLNASHLCASHHVLMEGNYAPNGDSDNTHGDSFYMIYFRNHLSGQRASFTDSQHQRCAGNSSFGRWFTYIGNVLGRSGQMSGWNYIDPRMGCDVNGSNCVGGVTGSAWSSNDIWKISYDGFDVQEGSAGAVLQTLQLTIRDGNYDFLNNQQRWHNTPATFTMPLSLYLVGPYAGKPAFFNTYSNTWPWLDPSTGTINALPAKFRFDNGTPNNP